MKQATEIKWEDPPANARGGPINDWAKVADQLRQHPGRWALVAESVHRNLSVGIKAGKPAAFRPTGSFESTSRNWDSATKRVDVYARFIGEAGEHA